jgi:hypothetical protein
MSNFKESATREEAIAVNTDLRNFTQAVLGDPEKERNLAAYNERVEQVRAPVLSYLFNLNGFFDLFRARMRWNRWQMTQTTLQGWRVPYRNLMWMF